MLAVGDKVEIKGRPGETNTGKFGKIVQISYGVKQASQPVNVNLPKLEAEPRYSVKLNSGVVMNLLREQQLRKIGE